MTVCGGCREFYLALDESKKISEKKNYTCPVCERLAKATGRKLKKSAYFCRLYCYTAHHKAPKHKSKHFFPFFGITIEVRNIIFGFLTKKDWLVMRRVSKNFVDNVKFETYETLERKLKQMKQEEPQCEEALPDYEENNPSPPPIPKTLNSASSPCIPTPSESSNSVAILMGMLAGVDAVIEQAKARTNNIPTPLTCKSLPNSNGSPWLTKRADFGSAMKSTTTTQTTTTMSTTNIPTTPITTTPVSTPPRRPATPFPTAAPRAPPPPTVNFNSSIDQMEDWQLINSSGIELTNEVPEKKLIIPVLLQPRVLIYAAHEDL